jgi:hypothetical protein
MVLTLVATGPICTAHCWVNPLSLRGGQLPITPLTQTGQRQVDGWQSRADGESDDADMKHTRRFFA